MRSGKWLLLTIRTDDPPPTTDDITQALWYACHGGQQVAAEYLLAHGADLNWISTWDQLTRSTQHAVPVLINSSSGCAAEGQNQPPN